MKAPCARLSMEKRLHSPRWSAWTPLRAVLAVVSAVISTGMRVATRWGGGAARGTMAMDNGHRSQAAKTRRARSYGLAVAALMATGVLTRDVGSVLRRGARRPRLQGPMALKNPAIDPDDPFAVAEAQLRAAQAKETARAHTKMARAPKPVAQSEAAAESDQGNIGAPAEEAGAGGARQKTGDDSKVGEGKQALQAGGGIDEDGFGDGDAALGAADVVGDETLLTDGIDEALLACCPKDAPADAVCTCDASALTDAEDVDIVSSNRNSDEGGAGSADSAIAEEMSQELMPEWATEALAFRTASEMQVFADKTPKLTGVVFDGEAVELPSLSTLWMKAVKIKRIPLLRSMQDADSRSRERVEAAFVECQHETKEAVMQARHERVDQRRELWRSEAVKALVRSGIRENRQEEADIEDLLEELMQDADSRGQELPNGTPKLPEAEDALTNSPRVVDFFESCFHTSVTRVMEELALVKKREEAEIARQEAERVAREAMAAERKRQEEERKRQEEEERQRVLEEQRRIKAVAAERASSLARAVCEERRRDTLERGESAIAQRIDPMDPEAVKKVQAARLSRAEAVMQLCMTQFRVARAEVVRDIDNLEKVEEKQKQKRTKQRDLDTKKRERQMHDVESVALAAELEVLEATKTYHVDAQRRQAEVVRSRREKQIAELAVRDTNSVTRRGGGDSAAVTSKSGSARLRGSRSSSRARGGDEVPDESASRRANGEVVSLQEETRILRQQEQDELLRQRGTQKEAALSALTRKDFDIHM